MPRFIGARWGVKMSCAPMACSISGVCRWRSKPVGGEVLVHGAELRAFGQLSPGTGDPAGGVNHYACAARRHLR